MKKIKPNVAQKEALKQLTLVRSKGESKGVSILPTATGKTYLTVLDSMNFKGKILFIVHNTEILNQTIKVFQEFYPSMDHGVFTGMKKQINNRFIFATTQTLTKHLKQFDKEHFEYIIVDEVHHYQAKTYKNVINYFKPKFLHGLTATPYRSDNKDIFDICGKPVYYMSIATAMEKKLLCPLDYWYVDHNINFLKIKWNGRQYDKKDLNRKICIEEYDKAIYDEWKEKASDKQTIVFCATTKHVERLTEYFNNKGVSSCGLHGNGIGLIENKKYRFIKSPHSKKRKQLIHDFKKEVYKIVFVRDLFNEGVDLPKASCILLLRPTESSTIFTQQVGRGLRKNNDDTKKLLVLDFVGNAKKNKINVDVLTSILGTDLLSKVQKQYKSGKTIRAGDLVIVKNGCSVRFSRTNIDILNDNKVLTKEDIITEYCAMSQTIKHCKTTQEKKKILENYTRPNIVFIDKFPKSKIPTKNPRMKTGAGSLGIKQKGFSESCKEKNKLRTQIMNYIEEGDQILLLESPQLLALKEIIKQKKKPLEIVIPNNKEYNKMKKALIEFNTELNIRLINASALDYINSCDTKFDVIWLDYCGAFCYYKEDLEVCLNKHKLNTLKLFVTYNTNSFKKSETTSPIAEVVSFVLDNTTNHQVHLMKGLSYKYKKSMYNIGFDLKVRGESL